MADLMDSWGLWGVFFWLGICLSLQSRFWSVSGLGKWQGHRLSCASQLAVPVQRAQRRFRQWNCISRALERGPLGVILGQGVWPTLGNSFQIELPNDMYTIFGGVTSMSWSFSPSPYWLTNTVRWGFNLWLKVTVRACLREGDSPEKSSFGLEDLNSCHPVSKTPFTGN